MKNEYIYIEDVNIYDGYCAKYYPDTGEIELRESLYNISQMSDEEKENYKKELLQGLTNGE